MTEASNAKAFFDKIRVNFGEEGVWKAFLLISFIDIETWTLPEWIKSTPLVDVADYIMYSEELQTLISDVKRNN